MIEALADLVGIAPRYFGPMLAHIGLVALVCAVACAFDSRGKAGEGR